MRSFIPGNSFNFSSASLTTNIIGSYFTFGTGFFDYSISNAGSTFIITAIPEPSTYLAATGLLAVFLWPSRKRIIRYTKRTLGLRLQCATASLIKLSSESTGRILEREAGDRCAMVADQHG